MEVDLFLWCILLFVVSGQKFFVYDWPSEVTDAYPISKNIIQSNLSDFSEEFGANGGAGSALDADVGLYQTWQFSLFKNMYGRLLVSKYRTWYDY